MEMSSLMGMNCAISIQRLCHDSVSLCSVFYWSPVTVLLARLSCVLEEDLLFCCLEMRTGWLFSVEKGYSLFEALGWSRSEEE